MLSYPEAPTPIAAQNNKIMSKITQTTNRKLKTIFTPLFFWQVFRTEQAIKNTIHTIEKTVYATKGEYIKTAPVAIACSPK